jgi:peroxiredoxin family protein
MKLNFDYVYATPVFIFQKVIFGEEVDLFATCWGLDEEKNPIEYPRDYKTTIEHYYDGIEEMNELKKSKKSWAV